MFIRLEKTYEPLRAQIVAGVLRTHGIAAWVAGDVSSSNYGTIASGGCSVMVDETDAEEAKQILDANPAFVETAPVLEPPLRKPLSFWSSLGNGALQGAICLPVLSLLLYAVLRLIVIFGASVPPDHWQLTGVSRGIVRGILPQVFYGAAAGLIAGVVAWLLSSYRQRGGTGVTFVILVVIILLPVLFLLG